MKTDIIVIGYGAVGRAVVERLSQAGNHVIVIQRNRPDFLPDGAEFRACDVLDRDSIRKAVCGATSVICALGLPYSSKVWTRHWPVAMTNILSACEAARARLVIADNLYMYGPQNGPLTERLPLTGYGHKPRVRADITRLWRDAHAQGRVETVSVRSPEFYGPNVGQSLLGSHTFGRIAQGKPALLMAAPDQPHDVAHVDDFARALITLMRAPSVDYGQAWHVPCAATLTLRDMLQIGADALTMPLKVQIMPGALIPLAKAVMPIVREIAEMAFLFDRPYRVDATKFSGRFWSNVVPLPSGIAQAALSFR